MLNHHLDGLLVLMVLVILPALCMLVILLTHSLQPNLYKTYREKVITAMKIQFNSNKDKNTTKQPTRSHEYDKEKREERKKDKNKRNAQRNRRTNVFED